MKQPAQISLFLAHAKAFVEERELIFVDREQSLAFLAARGISIDDLKQIIMKLTLQDCFDGPEPDRDPRYFENWTVAEFSPTHNGEKLYLKISIRIDRRRCRCLSVKLWTERELTDERD